MKWITALLYKKITFYVSISRRILERKNAFFPWVFLKTLSLLGNKHFIFVRINKKSQARNFKIIFETSALEKIYVQPNNVAVSDTSESNTLQIKWFKNVYFSSNCSLLFTRKFAHIQKFTRSNFLNIKITEKRLFLTRSNMAFMEITPSMQIVEKGIFLCGFYPSNWFHWSIEILSKTALLGFLDIKYNNWPLLVPKEIEKSSNHLALLNHLFPSKEIIFIDSSMTCFAESLIYADSPIVYSPYRVDYSLCGVHHQFVNPYYANFYKELLIRGTDELNLALDGEKLFLARKQAKNRSYNQDEIERMVSKMGFRTIYCEDYGFDEQRFIFRTASIIIGPTGAAWANLIYSTKGLKALIWAPNCVDKNSMFSDLAYISDVQLNYYFYESKHKTWSEYMNNHVMTQIDVADLGEKIKELIQIK
jgi:capsular polysaccharide biosynthesis protein